MVDMTTLKWREGMGKRKFVFRAKKGTSEMWEARPRDKERGRGERDIKERERGVEIRLK